MIQFNMREIKQDILSFYLSGSQKAGNCSCTVLVGEVDVKPQAHLYSFEGAARHEKER